MEHGEGGKNKKTKRFMKLLYLDLPLIPACICMYPATHFWRWMYLPEGLFLGSPFEMMGERLLSRGYSRRFRRGVGAPCTTWAA